METKTAIKKSYFLIVFEMMEKSTGKFNRYVTYDIESLTASDAMYDATNKITEYVRQYGKGCTHKLINCIKRNL